MKKLLLTLMTAAVLALPAVPGVAQTRDFHGQYPNRSQYQMRSSQNYAHRHHYDQRYYGGRYRGYYPRYYGNYPYYNPYYSPYYGPYYPPGAYYNYPYGGYYFTPYGGVVQVPPGTSFYGWY
jgi:hypothetical protein